MIDKYDLIKFLKGEIEREDALNNQERKSAYEDMVKSIEKFPNAFDIEEDED